jgi:glycosyltransferase involved in cell wall biosynthesis
MLKIFYSVNHSGCAWWRTRQPAEMIKKLGLAEVEIFSQYDTARDEMTGILNWCDICVAQSPAGVESVALMMHYQQIGKVVVIDYDDLVYSCSPFNPAYKTLGIRNVNVKDIDGVEQELWKDGVKGFSIKDNYCRFRSQKDLFKITDGMTLTNKHLLKCYAEENPDTDIEGKTYIYPNSMDFKLFRPFPKKENERIRIGWIASASHLSEIWMVKSIYEKLLAKYGNKVKFVILGDPKELTLKFTPEQLEFHPFVDLSVYPLKVAALNFDIGISPLEKDEFNVCKSQLKWSEYSAMKIPSVCSDLEPYECIEDGVTGYKAKTIDEFVEKISLLVESKELREKIAQNAYDKNYGDYNLEKNVTGLVKFYEDCYSRAGVYR